MFSFKDKVVLVTGSSTGNGRAIALGFAENGGNVIVHGNSNLEEAKKTLEEVKSKGVKAFLVSGDNKKRTDRPNGKRNKS